MVNTGVPCAADGDERKLESTLMQPIRARVRGGRLIVDTPVDLPEGTVFDLVLDDEAEELDPKEREAIELSLERGAQDADHGRTSPAEDVVRRLRERP